MTRVKSSLLGHAIPQILDMYWELTKRLVFHSHINANNSPENQHDRHEPTIRPESQLTLYHNSQALGLCKSKHWFTIKKLYSTLAIKHTIGIYSTAVLQAKEIKNAYS